MTPLFKLNRAIVDPAEVDLQGVQGGILKPHGRNHVILLLFQFLPRSTVAARRAWIASQAANVTTAAAQREAAIAFSEGGPAHTIFRSISISGSGYVGLDEPMEDARFLESGPDERPVSPLKLGMAQRATLLGDLPGDGAEREPEYQADLSGPIDLLILIAGNEWERVQSEAETVVADARDAARLVKREDGHQLRRGSEPIEHFGYRDGISQPLFFADDAAKQTTPGHGKWDPSAGPSLVFTRDPFVGDSEESGSYLVYRKLRQSVETFHQVQGYLETLLDVQSEADRQRLEAIFVGRTPDGAAVSTSKGQHENDFDFAQDELPPFLCPLHAHARKANPRRDVEIRANVRNRRIARRSVTYGVDAASLQAQLDVERGMLFMCYQRAISTQFEFIQHFWLRSKDFPMIDCGVDPFLGGLDKLQRWMLEGRPVRTADREQRGLVTLRGGEYFFTPSMKYLRTIAGA